MIALKIEEDGMDNDLWSIRNKRSTLDIVESLISDEARRIDLSLSLDWLMKYRHDLIQQIQEIQLANFNKTV